MSDEDFFAALDEAFGHFQEVNDDLTKPGILKAMNVDTGEFEDVVAEPVGVALLCNSSLGQLQFSWQYDKDEDQWVAFMAFQCPNCNDLHVFRMDDSEVIEATVMERGGTVNVGPNARDFHDACDHLASMGAAFSE